MAHLFGLVWIPRMDKRITHENSFSAGLKTPIKMIETLAKPLKIYDQKGIEKF